MDEPPPDYILRLVVILLFIVILAPILLTTVRGIMCAIHGTSCPFNEYTFATEQLGSYIATVVALLLALLSRK
jgi:hypothetical protein